MPRVPAGARGHRATRRQFIRRDGHRRKARGRFRLQKTEAGLHFARCERPQARIVDQHQQLDVMQRARSGRSHGHPIDHDGQFRFEVDAILFTRQRHVIASAQKIVRRPLVHQRNFELAVDRREPEDPLHEIAMAVKCRAIEPLRSTGQRRGQTLVIELEGSRRRGRRSGRRTASTTALDFRPTLERIDECRRNGGRGDRALQIVRNHDEFAVALFGFQCRKFQQSPRCSFVGRQGQRNDIPARRIRALIVSIPSIAKTRCPRRPRPG